MSCCYYETDITPMLADFPPNTFTPALTPEEKKYIADRMAKQIDIMAFKALTGEK